MQTLFQLQNQIHRVRYLIVLVLTEVKQLDAQVTYVLAQSEALQRYQLCTESRAYLHEAETLYYQINDLYDVEYRLSEFLDTLRAMSPQELMQAAPIVEDFKLVFESMLREYQIPQAVQLFNQCSYQFMRACCSVEADSSD